VEKPTRLNNLLDLVISSDPNLSIFDPIDYNISDHLLTYFDIQFLRTKQKAPQTFIRNYEKINWKNFISDLTNINSSAMSEDPEDAIEFLCSVIKTNFDRHAPITKKHPRKSRKGPNFSHKTKRLIAIKDFHYRRKNISAYSATQLKTYTKLITTSIK